jgi:hypothetical protein
MIRMKSKSFHAKPRRRREIAKGNDNYSGITRTRQIPDLPRNMEDVGFQVNVML